MIKRILNTVEAFAGTKSFSKVMAERGHETLTIDNDPKLDPDVLVDILTIHNAVVKHGIDLFWASPPCQGFSVAVIGRNWNYDYTPKTDSARLAMALAKKTIAIIEKSKPTYWFVENPRGMLRKMPFMIEFLKRQGGVRHTVWYCRYGDDRAKPTDIWTNALFWKPRPPCHNRKPSHAKDCGCFDHAAASRGSRTGTQGIQGARDRGRIPAAIFEEILEQLP